MKWEKMHDLLGTAAGKILIAIFILCSAIGASSNEADAKIQKGKKMEKLELTREWDKVFPKSDKVNHEKVVFKNRYGITLAADMYIPKNFAGNSRWNFLLFCTGRTRQRKSMKNWLYANLTV